MSTKVKVFIGLAVMFALFLILLVIFGSDGKNESFQPQEEFKLEPWIELKLGPLDMSINKAVMYLFIAAALTCATMIYIAKRMVDKPNKVQTAVEVAYNLTSDQITGQNMDKRMATKWFAFIATLF